MCVVVGRAWLCAASVQLWWAVSQIRTQICNFVANSLGTPLYRTPVGVEPPFFLLRSCVFVCTVSAATTESVSRVCVFCRLYAQSCGPPCVGIARESFEWVRALGENHCAACHWQRYNFPCSFNREGMRWLLVVIALVLEVGRVGSNSQYDHGHDLRGRHHPAYASTRIQTTRIGHWTGSRSSWTSRLNSRKWQWQDCKRQDSNVRPGSDSTRWRRPHHKPAGPMMCGVIGILLADHGAQVSPELYDGLTILQHRGQDAAGIATSDGRRMFLRKDKGLARDVFGVETMESLHGAYGVGHVRYPTSGCNSVEEAQPIRNNVPVGFCVAHNGHLSNGQLLKDQLSATRHFNTESDTELLSELFGMELAARRPAIGPPVTHELLFEVVQAVMARCRGGYAVTILINGYGILAFRDPHGVRPLCLGARPGGGGSDGGICSGGGGGGGGGAAAGGRASGGGGGAGDGRGRSSGKMDLAVASESAALTGLGFSLKRDVAAGEAVFLDASTGSISSKFCSAQRQQQQQRQQTPGCGVGSKESELKKEDEGAMRRGVASFKPCLFEYVYMARPDSIIDGVPVYAARVAMGLRLAKKIASEVPLQDVDVVVPVPETSRVAAMHCAALLGLPFEEGLTKNRYVGRTFIMPGQAFRRQNVRKKLSAVSCVLEGRSVLLVDDSIVRGTTSREIVRIVREAGARKVYFCSASPPVRHPNCYGIDLPRQSELLAHGLGEEEIAEAIGADGIVFQDLEALEDAVSALKPGMFSGGFENSMFTGEYLMPSDMMEGDPADGGGADCGMGPGPRVVDVV